ncbi:Epidermal growth factor-binding protein type B [Blomia tropicalis]|nr:Epidermal growth factor-binding protein type B [Blomia tropicalis]
MNYFIVILFIVNVVNAGRLSLKSSIDENELRIIGGQNVKDGEAPWQVAIQNPSNPKFLCGGSILSQHWIVTAASCLEDFEAKELLIRYNTLKLNGGQTVILSLVFKHDNYSYFPRQNDIAVARTLSPLSLGQMNANSIMLPKNNETNTGTHVNVTGWGVNNSTGQEYSQDLKSVDLTIVDLKKCKETYTPGQINDQMFCANAGKDNVCTGNGDNGGPAAKDKKLLGIIITQFHYCRKEDYDIFTDVFPFVEWINQKIKFLNSLVLHNEIFLKIFIVISSVFTIGHLSSIRIFGGRDVKDGEAPWQVAIQKLYNSKFLCGGSILSNHWVVTAASCLDNSYAISLRVRYNTLTLSGGQVLIASKVVVHKNYTKTPRDFDIALVRTVGAIKLGQMNSNLIKLPEKMEVKNGTMVNVTGWGAFKNGSEEYSPKLQIDQLKAIDQKMCKQHYVDVTDRMFCAKGQSMCSGHGDQGGPASNNQTLLGVTITENNACDPNEYDIFTDVYQIVDWIKEC